MGIIDAIAIAFLLAIVALLRYAWKHRKRTVKRTVKRVPLERTGERYGKSRAAEREWIKGNSHV